MQRQASPTAQGRRFINDDAFTAYWHDAIKPSETSGDWQLVEVFPSGTRWHAQGGMVYTLGAVPHNAPRAINLLNHIMDVSSDAHYESPISILFCARGVFSSKLPPESVLAAMAISPQHHIEQAKAVQQLLFKTPADENTTVYDVGTGKLYTKPEADAIRKQLYAAVNSNDYDRVGELAAVDVYPLTVNMLFKHVHKANESALRLLFAYKRGVEAVLANTETRTAVIDALRRQANVEAFTEQYDSLAGGRVTRRVRRIKRSTTECLASS